MSDTQKLPNPIILEYLNVEFSMSLKQMRSALTLLINGATVPFVARYRKEATGGLDETELQNLLTRYEYYEDLESRKETVLATIEKQDKLTDELKAKIVACREKNELEDIYAPYKPRRRTRAQKAKEKGLEPLADQIWKQAEDGLTLEELAEPFLSDEVETVEDALSGAHDILAEHISDNTEIRQWLRKQMWDKGMLTVKVRKEWQDEPSKYEMYYDYEEPVSKVPSHRFLAIRRGADEEVLNYSISMETEPIYENISKRIIKQASPYEGFLREVVKDAYDRLLSLSISSSVLADVREQAEDEAIKVFAKNARELFMAPPAGHKNILAIDPGFRTGCKVAVIDSTGKFLTNTTIYPHPPREDITNSEIALSELIEEYNIELVAIGNGTAGRETLDFVREMVENNDYEVTPVLVNESGASIYSASEAAIEEFPDLDLTVRGAISIGRRLQDPLAELVKIDPKSIGVGQYQHDVNQSKLKEELDTVVSLCVNAVGVDLNTASKQLLSYISGISSSVAQAIVKRREKDGPFKNREELMEVSGVGPMTFEQSAGFLKIPDGENPLDNSNVHPESYYIVEKMCQDIGKPISAVIGKGVDVDPKQYVDEEKGLPTINDILGELKRPGRDPRDEFQYASFKEGVNEIGDLNVGMILEGTVTNVTHFGAFVDIGVHQDGLVHISEMANKFVKDPHKIVHVGQVVKVKVLSVEEERKRIGLSIKQAAN